MATTDMPIDDEEGALQTLLEYQAILDNASLGITFTRNRVFLHCNERFSEMFGWTSKELIGQPTSIAYPSPDAYRDLSKVAEQTLGVGKRMDIEVLMQRRDGSTFWCRMMANAIDPQDHSKGTIFITEDITERRAAGEAIRQLLLEQQAILANAHIGIAFVKQDRIITCNQHLEHIYGYPPGELADIPFSKLLQTVDSFEPELEIANDIAREGSFIREVRQKKKDGGLFWCSMTANLVDRSALENGAVWLLDDISERKQAQDALMQARLELELRVQERTAELANSNRQLQHEIQVRQLAEEHIRHLANHDALTGLPNRRLLEDRLEHALSQAKRNQNMVAVKFIDLDRFKEVNDTLGHRVGDLLLQTVANRLRSLLREIDTISRIGGDEFILVLSDMTSEQHVLETAEKILLSLSQTYFIEQHTLHTTPSIGIAIYPQDGDNPEQLMSRADVAMYQVKKKGRKGYHLFRDGDPA
ncbi:diguanylate cyclase domain-containing protein [Undibacterium sp.]|jgi:diguanylate cyclase (GGDEF)-like protein/PAS domain S-box-containing protein|uniref:diguanylate cyclase domain-containing protein n=1 Tax=Undibacterium sp. TaxID=1914977 RepID=UPI002C4ABC08|nr:diguanylate cyclase [Undibacterium sp.]HTD02678.1 diguanylate cyclase [Undibacterium sp.]